MSKYYRHIHSKFIHSLIFCPKNTKVENIDTNHNNMSDISARKPVGIIGAGSFGTAIAGLIALNYPVIISTRREEVMSNINAKRLHIGQQMPDFVQATTSMKEVAEQCTLIFPIVSSENFREMMREFSPHLRPHHILIHGTKGFDTTTPSNTANFNIKRKGIHTMSEVILQESSVVRVGCLSGPNLAAEIMEGQPAATVIASKYNEVIKSGRLALQSPRFQAYASHDILGAELAGALKNIIALGSGILGGIGMGKNVWALYLTRGLIEMIHVGKAMGADTSAFLGLAGIGDLVATAASTQSRNYTFGKRLAQGESATAIIKDMNEVAEGVRTLKIIREAVKNYDTQTPIIEMLYQIVFEERDINDAISYLMNYKYSIDVDFL